MNINPRAATRNDTYPPIINPEDLHGLAGAHLVKLPTGQKIPQYKWKDVKPPLEDVVAHVTGWRMAGRPSVFLWVSRGGR